MIARSVPAAYVAVHKIKDEREEALGYFRLPTLLYLPALCSQFTETPNGKLSRSANSGRRAELSRSRPRGARLILCSIGKVAGR